jgi:mono/diheme cytochrome c family protein
MDNLRRLWLGLGLLVVVLMIGACSPSPDESVIAGDAARGRDLWVQSACVGCHGIDAEGDRGGPALVDTPLSVRQVTSIVRRGGPGMPKYTATQIDNQAIQDMYAWFQNPLPVATGAVEQDPWVQAGCGGCHGANGGGGSAPGLTGRALSYGEFQRVVRQGAEDMPAYGPDRLNDADLQQMYDGLQALGQTPAATAEVEQDPWVQAGCGGCHGPKAEGASAPPLAGRQHSYAEFQRVVRGGARGMPAYGPDRLSDADLQRVYDWLQDRAQPPTATAATAEVAPELWIEAGCGSCHGLNAEGGLAPGLAGGDEPYAEFERVVREGAEGMPAYSADRIGGVDLRRMYDWLAALP